MKLISRSHLRELRRLNDFPEAVKLEEGLSDNSRQLISLANKLTEPHLFEGNAIQVFTTGEDKFETLLRDIEQAQEYIHVQYFILENDSTGKRLIELLQRKAREGVRVRVLYDYVGSFYMRPKVLKQMRAAGIDVHPFMELTFTQFFLRINWRNHRKIVVIDGRVGYVGGMNIADRYVTGTSKEPAWRDTHLRIEGNAVVAMQYSFAIDWDFTTRELLNMPPKKVELPPSKPSHLVQMVNSGPAHRWNNISFVFLKAITLAKHSLYIQTPYFLPSDPLLKAMQSAALAGVDVRVMIPTQPDKGHITINASRWYVEQMLQAGVRFYFYDNGYMHSKTIVSDDQVTSIGSVNIDSRSLSQAFEIDAFIYDREVALHQKQLFLDDIKFCHELDLKTWQQRPRWDRVKESFCHLLAPLL